MTERDFTRMCKKFMDKLGPAFLERIERRVGEDFEKAVENRPREVLETILDDIYLRFILPLEISLDVGAYLAEVYHIRQFDLALSERYRLYLSERQQEMKSFLESFHRMVEGFGLMERFVKSREHWWRE